MCWYCGSPVGKLEFIGRSTLCDGCGKDIRCCHNCRFYLSGAKGDCSETRAEPVSDKERANFCDWFSLDPKYLDGTAGQKKEIDQAKAARTAFDNLFN